MNPVVVHLPSRRFLIVAAVVGMMFLVTALMTLVLFAPSQHAFYPKCLLHSLTGLNCAGCGSLRAMHHLLHGEFLLAFRCNALLVLSMTIPFLVGIRWLRGEPPAAVIGKWFSRPKLTLGLLGVAILFSGLANLPFAAFTWLNP